VAVVVATRAPAANDDAIATRVWNDYRNVGRGIDDGLVSHHGAASVSARSLQTSAKCSTGNTLRSGCERR
jgi:hypothetical protein